jgi:hypothetical protein
MIKAVQVMCLQCRAAGLRAPRQPVLCKTNRYTTTCSLTPQTLQDLDHRLVARFCARCERLVEVSPSNTGTAGNGRHSARLGDITNGR